METNNVYNLQWNLWKSVTKHDDFTIMKNIKALHVGIDDKE